MILSFHLKCIHHCNDHFVQFMTVQMDPISSAVFREVIERIEKLTKIFRLSLNFTVCFLMFPKTIIILYEHFTTGLEADDYKLPFPVW